jgi:hypothetical protein
VRAAGSPELTWYVEMALLWTRTPLTPTLFVGVMNPISASRIYTYDVPNDEDNVMYFSSHFVSGGNLMASWVHSHATLFDEMWLFEGRLEDLGLHAGNGTDELI